MRGHIADGRAAQLAGDVVPAVDAAVDVIAAVETVHRIVSQVDAADEGDLAIDDDQLLVMGVHRALMAVQLYLDLRAGREVTAHGPHVEPPRPKDRQRGSRPQQHAHRNALRQLGQHVAQHDTRARARRGRSRG